MLPLIRQPSVGIRRVLLTETLPEKREASWRVRATLSPDVSSETQLGAVDAGTREDQDDVSVWAGLSAVRKAVVTVGCAAALAVWWGWASAHPLSAPLFATATVAVAAQPAVPAAVLAVKSAWAGMLAGCLHTLAGADHLAALTPLTIGRSKAKSALLGSLWGLGHSTGQLLLGLLMVLLKDRFNSLMPALTKWGGTMVGITLLLIGALGIYETFFEGEDDHKEGEEFEKIKKNAEGGKNFALATYATGIIYGLQPDALFVVIPALALPTKAAAAAYIIMFVIGTCGAMGSYTALIGHTTEAIKEKNPWITQNLALMASIFAIVVGVLILLPTFGIELPFSPF